jgi:hypothetical protein
LAPLPKKKATRKKTIIVMMKKEDEKSERVGKKWAYGEILHLIAL